MPQSYAQSSHVNARLKDVYTLIMYEMINNTTIDTWKRWKKSIHSCDGSEPWKVLNVTPTTIMTNLSLLF